MQKWLNNGNTGKYPRAKVGLAVRTKKEEKLIKNSKGEDQVRGNSIWQKNGRKLTAKRKDILSKILGSLLSKVTQYFF